MSISVPTYSRVPDDYPPTDNFFCLGVSRIVQFGQTRLGFWMNRTFTTTERANCEMYFGQQVLETPVDGSSKAGIPLKHPRWKIGGTTKVWGMTGTTCNGKLMYGQFVTNNFPGVVLLRWSPATAPAALKGKWLTPPLLIADIPIVAASFTAVTNICR